MPWRELGLARPGARTSDVRLAPLTGVAWPLVASSPPSSRIIGGQTQAPRRWTTRETHGSYETLDRAPHRDVLACRGLAQRGKLSTEHRALNFLAKQGDNGIVWTVLSYWRATD